MKRKDKIPRKRKYAKNADLNFDGMPASKRKMNYFRKKRTQNRIRTTINRTHDFVKIVSIICLLWLCSRLMISSFWYLPENVFETYPSKHLRIIGNKITPNDKVISSLKSIPFQNKPLYLIDTVPYEHEVEKLSPVKKAFVRRYWLPARFEVTLEEEVPLLTISPSPNAPEIAALTAEAKVITKDYLPITNPYYKTHKILTYDDYSDWSKKEIQSLKILAERIEGYSQEKLLYLDIRNKNDVYAQLETIKIRIGELNSTLKERIERLSSIMPQIENLKKDTDYVDIRWDNTTYLKKKPKKYLIQSKQNSKEKLEEKAVIMPKKPTVTRKTVKKITEVKTEKKLPENKVVAPQIDNLKNDIQDIPQIKIETIEP